MRIGFWLCTMIFKFIQCQVTQWMWLCFNVKKVHNNLLTIYRMTGTYSMFKRSFLNWIKPQRWCEFCHTRSGLVATITCWYYGPYHNSPRIWFECCLSYTLSDLITTNYLLILWAKSHQKVAAMSTQIYFAW